MTTNKKILYSPISFFGSKRKELHHIEKYQPEKFNKIIDVFGGGANVSLYYHQKGYMTHYNDIAKYLTDLMTIIQCEEETNKLITKIDLLNIGYDDKKIILTRDEFIKTSRVELYILLLRHSMRGMIYSGLLQKSKNKETGEYISETRGNYYKLKDYPPLFKTNKMKITNVNYLEVINNYKDDENAFIYCDPPYISTVCSFYGEHKFTLDDILTLNKIINDESYKCHIMIHIEFLGYTYDLFKKNIKYYYPKKYAINANKILYSKYIMIVTNY